MITKNKEAIIANALESTKGIFDLYVIQDTGSKPSSITKTKQILEDFCKKYDKQYVFDNTKTYPFIEIEGERILSDFSKARNDSFNLAKERDVDYIFWLDTDDELVNPEQIPNLAEFMKKNNIHMSIITYNYAEPVNGLVPVAQERERLIDARIEGNWLNRVHENYAIANPHVIMPSQLQGLGFNILVQHKRSGFDAQANVRTGKRRNNSIMLQELAEVGMEKFSDFMLSHLAYDHWEHREFDKSIEYYNLLLKRESSNNPQVRFEIYSKLAEAYLGTNNIQEALNTGNSLVELDKNHAFGYLILAKVSHIKGLWDETIHYAHKVLKIGKPNTTHPTSDIEYKINPLKLLFDAHINLNQVDKAVEAIQTILAQYPEPQIKGVYSKLQKDIERNGALQSLAKYSLYLQSLNEYSYIKKLQKAIPPVLLEDQTIRQMIRQWKGDYERKISSPKFKGKKTIVIYAGPHFEPWDGMVSRQTGIGGSEGMTIQMSEALAKLGNKVIIYGEPSQEVTINGVQYIHHAKFNTNLKGDIFISLRNPSFFNNSLSFKKQYLWLHDTYYGELNLTNFITPNKTIVLSEAHKEVIQNGYDINNDSLFWITRNALNKEAIKYADNAKITRNPNQFIYASSYDRGLDYVLEIWPEIRKVNPKAILKVFYGWNTFDALMNHRPADQVQQMKIFKEKMLRLLSQEGVFELGRIPQHELYKQFAESSIWLYPTAFYEISCVNAMTAQAMGTIPVVTPYAALNETVQYGYKLPRENTLDAIKLIYEKPEKHEKMRKEMKEWARETFDIDSLAQEWDKFFNED